MYRRVFSQSDPFLKGERTSNLDRLGLPGGKSSPDGKRKDY